MILESVRDGVVYLNGTSYLGVVEEVKLPEIQFRTTDRKPTGGIGVIELQGGLDKLEAEIKWTSLDRKLAGALLARGKSNQLMIRSLHQSFDGAGSLSKERALITHMTVQTKSLGLGEHKGGDPAEMPAKFIVHAVKQTFDGEPIIEIDVINQIFKIGGTDLLSNSRRILGI
ncbi:MAG: phage major tail tube protein [Laribacter sp.]|nr:phage major tail tube protein [Laribacter sp.]MBP9527589.1 phage major tail tube protein [Laribacter sp.]MBP9608547.1 phage major tail tube protein [Laribacter sp.]